MRVGEEFWRMDESQEHRAFEDISCEKSEKQVAPRKLTLRSYQVPVSMKECEESDDSEDSEDNEDAEEDYSSDSGEDDEEGQVEEEGDVESNAVVEAVGEPLNESEEQQREEDGAIEENVDQGEVDNNGYVEHEGDTSEGSNNRGLEEEERTVDLEGGNVGEETLMQEFSYEDIKVADIIENPEPRIEGN